MSHVPTVVPHCACIAPCEQDWYTVPLQSMARRWLAIRKVTALREQRRKHAEETARCAAVVRLCAMHALHAMILNGVYGEDFASAYTATDADYPQKVSRRGKRLGAKSPARSPAQPVAASTPGTQPQATPAPAPSPAGPNPQSGTDTGAEAEAKGDESDGGAGEADDVSTGDAPRDRSTGKSGKKKGKKSKKKGRRSKSPTKSRVRAGHLSRSRSKERVRDNGAQAEGKATTKRRPRSKEVLPIVPADTTAKDWIYPDYAQFEPYNKENPTWVRTMSGLCRCHL